jgi:hypothetical protein
MGFPNFNGTGGGNQGFDGNDIGEVNGPANWTLTGLGQDLVIHDRVDGGGTLTLHKFRNITIAVKNGSRILVVESDNQSVTINTVDGDGKTFLRNSGLKKILVKNGAGDILFQGDPPFVEDQNGSGVVSPEQ